MIGVCREKLDDVSGALVAYEEALDIDPEFSLALDARNRIIEKGSYNFV